MAAATIHIAPEVLASETFRPLVERANDWLRDALPPSDEPLRAEWTWVDNRLGDEMVALTLKDEYGSPTRLFRSQHLQDKSDAEHEFNGLIRSLLRTRTHFMLKRLQEASATPGE